MSAINKIMAEINRTDLKIAVLLSVLTVAVLAPFINKPFNVDDVFYLKMAEQIIKNPLEPYSFYINWSGITQRVWESRETTPSVCPVLHCWHYCFVWGKGVGDAPLLFDISHHCDSKLVFYFKKVCKGPCHTTDYYDMHACFFGFQHKYYGGHMPSGIDTFVNSSSDTRG